MSVLIIVDGNSDEQLQSLEKLHDLLDGIELFVSGSNIKKLIKKKYTCIKLNSNNYIYQLITSEILILLSDKIKLTKYNKSQIIISWFSSNVMEHGFNSAEINKQLSFIGKYQLDIIIGSSQDRSVVKCLKASEYGEIKKLIKGIEYDVNLFVFDSARVEEDNLITSKKLKDYLEKENTVSLLLWKGVYTSNFTSIFDHVINNNQRIIACLEEVFDVEKINDIHSKNINLINKRGAISFEMNFKKSKYLEKLEKVKVSLKELPLVTIIIPHYNTEIDLLCRAIDSAKDNLYKNIEILIVDDGSKEKAIDILPNQYLNFNELRVVRKDNEGLGLARNTGVKEAQGKYVFFLDSDDTITVDGLYFLVLHAEKYRLSMVVGKVVITDDEGVPMNISLNYLYNETYVKYTNDDSHRVFYAQMAHGKLIKKSVFIREGVWFKKGIYEDSPWSMELFNILSRYDFINIVTNNWYKYDERKTLSSTASLSNFEERYRSYKDTIVNSSAKAAYFKAHFWFSHEIIMYFKNYINFKKEQKNIFFNKLCKFSNSQKNLNFSKSKPEYYIFKSLLKGDKEEFEKHLSNFYEITLESDGEYDNYIALTHYHLMTAIIYAISNKRPARLYLNTGYVTFSEALQDKLMLLGLFDHIQIFEIKEVSTLIKQLQCLEESPKYIIPDVLYPPYKNIFSLIKRNECTYIFNSALPYWYYIGRTVKNIIKLEDGYNSIENELSDVFDNGIYSSILKPYIPSIFPDSALKLSNKIIISKNHPKIPNEIKDKVSIVDTRELIDKNCDEYNSALTSIYSVKEKGAEAGVLILTQPLDKVSYCTTNEKSRLYQKLIKEYKTKGPVYLKPHPADDFRYAKWRGIKVLSKDVPIEVYDINGFKCNTVVTFGSTGINNLSFAKNIISIYSDDNFSRNKVKEKIQEYIKGYQGNPIYIIEEKTFIIVKEVKVVLIKTVIKTYKNIFSIFR